MGKLDDRTLAKLDAVLEKVCQKYPHGGDHETRKFVAQKLKISAKKGLTTLDGLTAAANAAIDELSSPEASSGKIASKQAG
jgi:hypothetical protein